MKPMKINFRKHVRRLVELVRKMDWAERVAAFLQILVVLLSAAMTFLSPFRSFAHFFIWFNRVAGERVLGFMLFAGVINMGVVAHQFKKQNQLWYGVVEVIFGAAYGFSTAFSIKPLDQGFGRWATLVGCTYIIARGLNNISEAKARLSTDSSTLPQPL
jgi:hypothetical protein